jgi:hypothetical protein
MKNSMNSKKVQADKGVKLSALQKFLFYWAGANVDILSRPECTTERDKFASMGLTVLFTAMLASLSGGYAIFTIFGSVQLSGVFGALWGFGIIGNLDRLFIINLKKKQRKGWKTILGAGETLALTIPRLSLAILLALVITKPLEIKFFDKEIEAEITNNNALSFSTKEREIRNNSRITELNNLMIKKNEEKKQNNVKVEQSRDAYNCEISGSTSVKCRELGASGRPNIGPIADALAVNLRKIERETSLQNQTIDREILGIQSEIKQVENNLQNELAAIKQKQQNSDGLLMRLKTLESLSQKDHNIQVINFFVTLIFVMIETSPILIKILSPYGVYDAALENMEKKSIHRQQKEMEKYPELIDHEVDIQVAAAIDIKTIEVNEKKMAYLEMRQQITDQFRLMLQELLIEKSEDLKNIRVKVLDRLVAQLEQELYNYSAHIHLSVREIHERIKKFEQDILNQMLDEQINNSFRTAQLDDLDDDINQFQKDVDDFKNEDDSENDDQ